MLRALPLPKGKNVVWRIEHATYSDYEVVRNGPFVGSGFGRSLDLWNMPTCGAEGLSYRDGWHCAFLPKQFGITDRDAELLAEYGYVVRAYKAEDVEWGESQVLFHAPTAVELATAHFGATA